MFLLDTNVVSFLFKGHTLAQVYRPHLQGKVLAISFMTLAEILGGLYHVYFRDLRRAAA